MSYCLLMLIVLLLPGCAMPEVDIPYAIDISLPNYSGERMHNLGSPLPLRVVFNNVSDHAIKMKQPDKVWEVQFRVESPGEANDAGFGRIYVSRPDAETERTVVEEAPVISLKPQESYIFECDVMSRFPDMLPPGDFTLRVIDQTSDDREVASNLLQVRIRFTPESVPQLMAWVADQGKEPFARRWAVEWLAELKPDFKPYIPESDEPESVIEKSEKNIRAQLDSFQAWWVTAEGADSVNGRIEEINEQSLMIEDMDDEDDMQDEDEEESE